jgi:putative polyketide hydroxylase/tetracenomycin A2 monooxygenase-dioxygenase
VDAGLAAARTETPLDWFDQEFVLVTGAEGDAWLEAGADVARRLGVPLHVKRWPASHESVLEIGCGMGRRSAVLVRPDGHVAWRIAWCPPDLKTELTSVMMTLLAGAVAGHPAIAWR